MLNKLLHSFRKTSYDSFTFPVAYISMSTAASWPPAPMKISSSNKALWSKNVVFSHCMQWKKCIASKCVIYRVRWLLPSSSCITKTTTICWSGYAMLIMWWNVFSLMLPSTKFSKESIFLKFWLFNWKIVKWLPTNDCFVCFRFNKHNMRVNVVGLGFVGAFSNVGGYHFRYGG